LLAGLHAPGETSVVEPSPTRDHTERMLGHFGADIRVEEAGTGRRITLTGQPELTPAAIAVPADPSSAAFPAVAALLVEGSEITLPGICTNPTRTGLYTTLAEMGAALTWRNERVEGGEPVADLVVQASPLTGVEVPPGRAPAMIDEYPVLAMAAACAVGDTVFHGVGELRHKESDRLAAVAAGLTACGVSVEEKPDSLIIHGTSGRPAGGASIEAALDHRIAMSFLVLGLASEKPVSIDDASSIETSFPDFAGAMCALGADIGPGA
jgi:3-phosphoshikimate 1-carboxyvinyltransferase